MDKTKEETSYAEEGVLIMDSNQMQRIKMNEDAKLGLKESQIRQQFVTKKSAEIEKESGEKREKSQKLKSDSVISVSSTLVSKVSIMHMLSFRTPPFSAQSLSRFIESAAKNTRTDATAITEITKNLVLIF